MHTPQATGSELSIVFENIKNDLRRNGYTVDIVDGKQKSKLTFNRGYLAVLESRVKDTYLPYLLVGFRYRDETVFVVYNDKKILIGQIEHSRCKFNSDDPNEVISQLKKQVSKYSKVREWTYFVSENENVFEEEM